MTEVEFDDLEGLVLGDSEYDSMGKSIRRANSSNAGRRKKDDVAGPKLQQKAAEFRIHSASGNEDSRTTLVL